jgi:hypothetical protein
MDRDKKASNDRSPKTPPAKRKPRFDPPHPRVPKPHYLDWGKDRPNDR